MITRGLLAEQAGGVFTCVITVPADQVGELIAGRPITVSPLDVGATLKVSFEGKEPTPTEKPPTQQISGAGDLAPLIIHEPEAHQEVKAFVELLQKWSMHPGFQARAKASLNPDPFQGPIVVANHFIRIKLDRMTLAQAMLEMAQLTEGLTLSANE